MSRHLVVCQVSAVVWAIWWLTYYYHDGAHVSTRVGWWARREIHASEHLPVKYNPPPIHLFKSHAHSTEHPDVD